MDLGGLLSISKDLSVLYVEDDVSKDSTAKLLEQIFSVVTVAVNGVDGLIKYEEYYEKNDEYFDIIISDINMPRMNGLELTEKIFNINKKQTLIIISAYDDSNNLIKLLNMGVTYFIQKPIKFDRMISILSKICAQINSENLMEAFNERIKLLNEDLKDSNMLLERKVQERTSALQKQLDYDQLTSVKSYYSLMTDIENKNKTIFFVLNIDSFHNINSLYGYEEANSILIQFAQCLKLFNSNLRYDIYRVYADEFVVFKELDEKNLFEYEDDLYDLINTIKNYNFTTTTHESVVINCSIGLSIAQENALMTANMALRHAKKHRLSYVVYNSDLDSSITINNVLKWSTRLKKAIDNNLVLTAYQPIVDKNKKVLKYEVLMRVAEQKNNTFSVISPYEFLEPAIKTKHYNSMMEMLIEKSFITMYNRNEQFSINLSYEDIYNQTLINIIKENLRKFKKIGQRLIIEILETESIEDLEIMKKFVSEVRKFGVGIAIDDFGTGHSNFANIMAIEPDYIKIDGSFIKNIHNDPKAYALVKGIVTSSKELKIKTIAEFVHNKEVFEILLDLGVDEFQGYYFSEPLLNI